jgi:hypothetical protein
MSLSRGQWPAAFFRAEFAFGGSWKFRKLIRGPDRAAQQFPAAIRAKPAWQFRTRAIYAPGAFKGTDQRVTAFWR